MGGALAAATAAKQFGPAAVLTFGTQSEPGFGRSAESPKTDTTIAPLQFLDDDGALVDDMMPHTEARTEQQLETETLRAVAEHDMHVAAHGADASPPAEPDEPLHAGCVGAVGGNTGHWVVGVTAMEAALGCVDDFGMVPAARANEVLWWVVGVCAHDRDRSGGQTGA